MQQQTTAKVKRPARKFDLKFDLKEDCITLAVIAVVCFVQSAALAGFYVPHGFLSGGITGVAMLINYSSGLPTWLFVLLLNIPTCLLGLKYLRPKSMLFSTVAPLLVAVTMRLVQGWDFGVQNPLVSAAAGSAIIGVSGAFVIRRDATMGGTDIVTSILSRRYSIPMGNISIAYNVVIMGVLGFMRGLELALVSMVAMFICNMAFNAALRALNRTVSVFIISDKWEELAPMLLNNLHRGVTYIQAEGAYTGQPRKLVYCIMRPAELSGVKRIVKDLDPHALFSIIETQEVVGRGFGSFN
ncbi:MAG: YitT family protein [Christensenellaceae bacterium]|nr:YitT family protein [Christensenellaceae bacterium]